MLVLGHADSESELIEIVAALRAKHSGAKLLFRGQGVLHKTISAARNRSKQSIDAILETAWVGFSSKILGLPRPVAGSGHAKAVLQHYGFPTYFLDLTDSERIASWFAVHEAETKTMMYVGSVFRSYDSITYHKRAEGMGYVLVFAIPNPDELVASERLFDLSHLPAVLVRPKRQNAWLLLDRPPTKPEPNDLLVGVIELDCAAFTSELKQTFLFPSPSEDTCYSKLLSIPFIETPIGLLEESSGNEDQSMKGFSLATRALPTPEYVEKLGDECINHKWNDIWIYEPKPMKVWRGWRYDLSTTHPTLKGDVRDTTKVILSPSAKRQLFKNTHLQLVWPSVGCDGLFFTYGELEHDKFSDHSDPYYGVWLQKNDDIISEIPMVAEDETLTVTDGHVYFFNDGKLTRQQTQNSCRCAHPESHDERIKAALRLSEATRNGLVFLISHPQIEKCFVAFSEEDMDVMRPGIERTHTIMQMVFSRLRRAPSQPAV